MRALTLAIAAAATLATLSCGGGGSSQRNRTSTDDGQHRHCVTIETPYDRIDFAGEEVPIDRGYIREAIERELLTTACMHTGTALAIRRTTRYFPVIEPILKEYGLPDDFKYLAMAESGLNENAVSPARASGFWQFLASAGKEYGLEVNDTVDERYHIEKATRAACEYLVKAYEQFGSWSLAAASYNAGRSGVERRLKIQDVDDYWDLFLPEETMRYVPRILSFKLLMDNTKRYGFDVDDAQLKPFKHYKTVEIDNRKIEWSKFAAEHNTTYRELRILNPWIRDYEHKNSKRKVYEVKVPTYRFRKLGY